MVALGKEVKTLQTMDERETRQLRDNLERMLAFFGAIRLLAAAVAVAPGSDEIEAVGSTGENLALHVLQRLGLRRDR